MCGDTELSSRDVIEKILEIAIDIFHTCFQNILSLASLNVMYLCVSWGEQTIHSLNRH